MKRWIRGSRVLTSVAALLAGGSVAAVGCSTPQESGTAVAFKQIMQAYGMDPDNDVKAFQDAFGDAASKLKDGQVDAAFGALAMPAGAIEEISTSTPVEVVEISGDPLQKVMEANPTYTEIDVPEGTYGDSAASKTVTNWATPYGTSKLDETLACNLTRVMYESAGDMEHSAAKEIMADTADEALGAIKMHPGSEKYIKNKSCD